MTRVRVMIVDDHAVVRLGIRSALESDPDITVTGESGDGESALRDAEVLRPDVILMDVLMPGIDGIEACRVLRENVPEARVLMLTSHSDEEAVMAAILAGASGYLLKNTGPKAIVRAVKAVASGESLLDPAVTARVLDQVRRMAAGQRDPELESLSPRERDVLAQLGQGMTNKEIGVQLDLSPFTVRNHVSSILAKLDFSRRTEAVRFATERKLTDTDPA